MILRVFIACDDTANRVLRGWLAGIRERWPDGVTDWVPSKRSVLLHYDLLRCNLALCEVEMLSIGEKVFAMENGSLRQASDTSPHSWSVPVCYDGVCGLDRATVEDALGMDWERVVGLHLTSTYRVAAVGFSPGFAYMDGLHPALRLPRKRMPLLRVPQGSVAIAEEQCGIYPVTSPGGWHILGKTSMHLFAPDRPKPSLLQVGDSVRFIREFETPGQTRLP